MTVRLFQLNSLDARRWALLWVTWFSSASVFGDSVRELYVQNRLDEAATICSQFEVLSTTEADNFVVCAWVNLRLDKFENAEKFLAKLRGSPTTPPDYPLLLAYSQMKRKQWDLARATVNQMIEQNRGGQLGLMAQELSAEIYEAAGQADTAAFIYKQIVGEDASRTRAHWGLARYYLAKNEPIRAKSHLAEVTKAWPKHVSSRFNLAILALQTDDLPTATTALIQAYRINQADAGVIEQLGILFERKGSMPEAIKYWRKAVALSSDSKIAKEKLVKHGTAVVDSMLEAGQFEDALKQIALLGKQVAKEPSMLLKRAIALRHLRQYRKAIDDLKTVLILDSRNMMAYREMGINLANLKRFQEALQTFKKGLELDPSNGLGYAWMAYCFESLRNFEQARAAWRGAVRFLSDASELSRAKQRLATLEAQMEPTDRAVSGKAEAPPSTESQGEEPRAVPAWQRGAESGAQVPQ